MNVFGRFMAVVGAASTIPAAATVDAQVLTRAASSVAGSSTARSDSLAARSMTVRALRAYVRAIDLTSTNGLLRDFGYPKLFVASRQFANVLDSAASLSPYDDHIAAVRVYNHVMALRYKEAEQAALECRSGRWWCSAALGFALHGGNRYGESERAYEKALALMPREQRCLWDDISQIMNDAAFVTEYIKFACEERAELNARIWWLSSPLWMNNGNDRRTEHYSRWYSAELLQLQTELLGWRSIRTDTVTDEVASIIRMGDLEWFGGLNVGCHSQLIARLYCEGWQTGYMFEQRHVVRREAVGDPFLVSVFDLTLAPFWAGVSYTENADTRAPPWIRGHPDSTGFARMKGEGYAPIYGEAYVMRDAQTALLLRSDGSARLLASYMPGETGWRATLHPATEWLERGSGHGSALRRGVLSAAVVVSAAPGVMDVATGQNVPPAPVRLTLTTRHDSAIVSLEARTMNIPATPPPPSVPRRLADRPMFVRHRFAAFRPDIGVTSRVKSSDVVFYDAGTGAQPKSAETVLALMLPRSTVARDLPLGLYWETYGLRPGEAPEFELSVTPVDPSAGIIGSVARAVGLASRPGSVLTSWKALPVTAQSIGPNNETTHSLVITLATLSQGTYRLALTTRVQGDTVRVSKLIRVR